MNNFNIIKLLSNFLGGFNSFNSEQAVSNTPQYTNSINSDYPEVFFTKSQIQASNQIANSQDEYNTTQSSNIFNNDILKNLLPLLLGKAGTKNNLANILNSDNLNYADIISMLSKNKSSKNTNAKTIDESKGTIDLTDYIEVE